MRSGAAARRFYLPLLFVLLVAVGLLLAAPSLDANWFSDDLYLVRQYSPDELTTSLVGSWQPAYLGTRGYRPLTPIFYGVTYLISGDSPAAYRVEQIVLFALMLLALALAALELGFSRAQVTIVCLIILCARNTWWMLLWPTDGVRLFMALFGNLALYFALIWLRTHRRGWLALAVACYLIALLTREEALPYALLIPLIGGWKYQDRRRALWIGGGLLAVSLIFFAARRVFVPDAISTLFLPGWLPQISFAVAPLLFNWPPLIGFAVLWALILLARPKRSAWFWLACVLIAAAPGIVVWRGNNALLEILFMGLFLVSVFSQRRALPIAALALVLIGSVVAHETAQLGLAPNSSERVSEAREFLYGEWQNALVWMPTDRRFALRVEADTGEALRVPPFWDGW